MVICIRDLLVMGLVGVLIVVLGMAISLVGFLLMLFGALLSGEEDREDRVEGGGVLIIGPIPIVFGTSRRAALVAAIIGLVLVAVTIAFLVLTTW
ncbi:TIGR00304 family membrane protein [Thermogladius sp.]|uniref:TIGR00304 family membrane protein n=1 Tax=Thermogladius sp. TaxID=2023064 RepID=UPI003D0A101C